MTHSHLDRVGKIMVYNDGLCTVLDLGKGVNRNLAKSKVSDRASKKLITARNNLAQIRRAYDAFYKGSRFFTISGVIESIVSFEALPQRIQESLFMNSSFNTFIVESANGTIKSCKLDNEYRIPNAQYSKVYMMLAKSQNKPDKKRYLNALRILKGGNSK